MPLLLLALSFFVTAALYASVGFGGGSTYIALLALAELDYRLLPVVALVCNIIVVTGATVRFQAAGLIEWRRVLPILALSVPFAWAGGRFAIEREWFLTLLGATLLLSALVMVAQPWLTMASGQRVSKARGFAPLAGAGIGFLSGLVGIGGGIFLSPLLHLVRWASPRAIAATASVFILVNSIAGLAGQLAKTGAAVAEPLSSFWPLFVAVLVGGQIGSHLASRRLPESWIRIGTAVLIVYVALRLLSTAGWLPE